MNLLARFFFVRLFDFELMSESRSPGSLARAVTGIGGVLAAIGALLARVFMHRYGDIREAGNAELFQATALTDHAFLLAALMWIVGFVTVLAGPSLFPDETDFRVLTPMPVNRRIVFGAKLVALAWFAGLFFVFALVAELPLFLMSSMGQLAQPHWLVQLPAYAVAAVLAGLFAALAVTAVHALLLIVVPRERLLFASAATGSALLFAFVMALPFVGRIPSIRDGLESGSTWPYLCPPAWFLGIERWLAGDARLAPAAAIGVGALALAAGLAATAYIVLYRDFSRVMTRPASDQGERLHERLTLNPRGNRRPAFTAVRTFARATMVRSVLHQGVFVAIFAIGGAVVAGRLLDVDFSPGTVSAAMRLESALVGAPFALSFLAILAARAALILPIELRANWVFRLTEDPRHRGAELDAAVSSVIRLGVFLPALLLLPLQWRVLGGVSLETTAVAVLCGWVLVEAVFLEWRRIPFTCSYTIGSGFVPQMALLGLLLFVGFTTVGSALAHAGTRSPTVAVAACAGLALAALSLRRHRRWCAVAEPLQFDDVLPTESGPLRLSAD